MRQYLTQKEIDQLTSIQKEKFDLLTQKFGTQFLSIGQMIEFLLENHLPTPPKEDEVCVSLWSSIKQILEK